MQSAPDIAASGVSLPTLHPIALLNLRISAMQWALSTATAGENGGAILGRAMAYSHFCTEPFRENVLKALEDRAKSETPPQ